MYFQKYKQILFVLTWSTHSICLYLSKYTHMCTSTSTHTRVLPQVQTSICTITTSFLCINNICLYFMEYKQYLFVLWCSTHDFSVYSNKYTRLCTCRSTHNICVLWCSTHDFSLYFAKYTRVCTWSCLDKSRFYHPHTHNPTTSWKVSDWRIMSPWIVGNPKL